MNWTKFKDLKRKVMFKRGLKNSILTTITILAFACLMVLIFGNLFWWGAIVPYKISTVIKSLALGIPCVTWLIFFWIANKDYLKGCL